MKRKNTSLSGARTHKSIIPSGQKFSSENCRKSFRNWLVVYYWHLYFGFQYNTEFQNGWYLRKFFIYVTKTHANLTTYSIKLENYNGTIIFEIDTMKKFTQINLNLCQTWQIFWLFLLFWFTLNLSWECCESRRKEVLFWFWQWRKMWILNWVGMSFSWC